jgi:hypothetical protein
MSGPSQLTESTDSSDNCWFFVVHVDGEGSLNLRIKTLEEKIPSSYDQLRQHIERFAKESRAQLTPPIIGKELFW